MYPMVNFHFKENDFYITSNHNAIQRILDNIISNACKYSIDKGSCIKISYRDNSLIVQDNGKGIKYPQKIFERNYKEAELGHGIGMHIVYRLCSELSIKLNIVSNEKEGTTIRLIF
jgi:two-component system OmpR family sensor kinase